MVGIEGKAPGELEINLPASFKKPLVISDEFDHNENKLSLNWQWNHNPDDGLWSFTKRPGYLRLETGHLCNSILSARNTLTQRTEGPACAGLTMMDISNMKPGDHAGLVALQNSFGTVGIKVGEKRENYVIMCVNRGDGSEEVVEKIPFYGNHVFLKIEFNFEDSIDQAEFFYADDGKNWSKIGSSLKMKYTLDHFMGYRIGLFNYAAANIGGYVDFAYFHYEKRNF